MERNLPNCYLTHIAHIGKFSKNSKNKKIKKIRHPYIDVSERWEGKYPSISALWLRHWEHIITLFDYPEEIRRVIYTTNAIESLNSVIRKATKNRRVFPTDSSALKVVYLAVERAAQKWTMPVADWKLALNRFAIEFEDRMPLK